MEPATGHQASEHTAPVVDYIYRPLATKNSFRLLQIVRRQHGDGHKAEASGNGQQQDDYGLDLIETSRTTIEFDALSYSWGSSIRDHPLKLLDGSILYTTKNLQVALPYLVKATKKEYLWIDQICINQEDIEERNHQVGYMMKNIYGCLKWVHIWVWIDEPGKDSELLMDLVEANDADTIDFQEEEVKAVVQGREFQVQIESIRGMTVDILTRPWFERSWIVREAALPSSADVIVSPTRSTDISKLYKLVRKCYDHYGHYLIDTESEVSSHAFHGLQCFKTIFDYRPDQQMRIGRNDLWLIAETAGRNKATNPRDRVYAFLDMYSLPYNPIVPDYLLSVSGVFRQASKAFLYRIRTDLTFLGFARGLCEDTVQGDLDTAQEPAQKGEGDSDYLLRSELPTWAMDWTVKPRQPLHIGDEPVAFYCSPGHYEPDTNEDPRLLTVKGKCLGKVDFVCDTSFRRFGPEEYTIVRDKRKFINLDHHLSQLQARRAKNYEPITRQQLLDVILCHQRLSDECLEGTPLERIYDGWMWVPKLGYKDGLAHLLDIYDYAGSKRRAPKMPIDPAVYVPTAAEDMEFRRLCQMACGRVLFSTAGVKSIGLGPDTVKAGDMIYILYGSRVPVILRHKQDNEYWFLGQCYMENVMEGKYRNWASEGAHTILLV